MSSKLLIIYNNSEYLQNILNDNNNGNINDHIINDSILLVYNLLNLNNKITYDELINKLIELINNYKDIKYNKENIIIYLTLYEYFLIIEKEDKFYYYIINEYIINNLYYKELYQFNSINYYLLDILSKTNDIKNETLEYLFKINNNLYNEIINLYSSNIFHKIY